MKRYVIGDIHGGYRALIQCLERAAFKNQEDMLICLGDVCDGWPETPEVIETLLKTKNLVLLLGNHDQWLLEWATTGKADKSWLSQGGAGTLKCYPGGMPKDHVALLQNAQLYYVLENRLFVHAGIAPELPMEKQDELTLLWDRKFVKQVLKREGEEDLHPFTSFDEVYLGHTPIHKYGHLQPLKISEVWLMDTGAAWSGVLSMMDIDTKEVYLSDVVNSLYPPNAGRKGE